MVRSSDGSTIFFGLYHSINAIQELTSTTNIPRIRSVTLKLKIHSDVIKIWNVRSLINYRKDLYQYWLIGLLDFQAKGQNVVPILTFHIAKFVFRTEKSREDEQGNFEIRNLELDNVSNLFRGLSLHWGSSESYLVVYASSGLPYITAL